MTEMTYEQALAYLHSIQRFGSKPGLTRIQTLLAHLGHPEKKLKYVHIAGTNGKSSTAAMAERMLRAAGLKTGLFVSPYVEDFRERVQISGAKLSSAEWAIRLSRIRMVVEKMLASGRLQPTEFEILTALALVCFVEHGCEIVVLEVGMGGRLDATNVIPAPEAAVITPLSLDHMEYLGNTLEGIAFEKCGIIKRGCHVVTAFGQRPEALAVIQKFCAEEEAPLVIPDTSQCVVEEAGLEGTRFSYRGQKLFLPLIGEHQVQNALVAWETMRVLAMRGFAIPGIALREGLGGMEWGGRLEVVREDPLCIIDGAHNPAKMAALCQTVDTLLACRRLVAVMGMSSDKDYAICAARIGKRSDVFIATQYESERALPAETLGEVAVRYCRHVDVIPDVRGACERALSLCGPGDVVLVCGSLYLIGEAKRCLATTNMNRPPV